MAEDTGPSFSLGLTQEISQINKDKGKAPANEEAPTTPLVPLRVVYPDEDERVTHMQRGKRAQTKSSVARSPYLQREIDLKKALTSEEEKVGRFLSCTCIDAEEIVFLSDCGHAMDVAELESLVEDHVDNNVLASWSVLLNYMEKYKSPEKPQRLFFQPMIISKETFMEHTPQNQYNFFATFVVDFYKSCKKEMATVVPDLMFIPVDNEGQQFLMTFDMRSGYVILFDQKNYKNEDGRVEITTRRKECNITVAQLIKQVFAQYVTKMKHVKAKKFTESELIIGDFKWQSTKQKKISGVYVMRCMETYYGEDLRKWDNGLCGGATKIGKQINPLKHKYAARLLLSECNTRKDMNKKNLDAMK